MIKCVCRLSADNEKEPSSEDAAPAGAAGGAAAEASTSQPPNGEEPAEQPEASEVNGCLEPTWRKSEEAF